MHVVVYLQYFTKNRDILQTIYKINCFTIVMRDNTSNCKIIPIFTYFTQAMRQYNKLSTFKRFEIKEANVESLISKIEELTYADASKTLSMFFDITPYTITESNVYNSRLMNVYFLAKHP